MPARGVSPRRVGRFVRAHLGYALLAPVLAFAGTVIHELAHAGAAILLGGQVTDLELWPSRVPGGIRFGATYYAGVPADRGWMVTMAPALVWTALAAVAMAWLGRLRGWPAKSLFLILYVLPLADIALQLGGLYTGRPGSDYYKAMGAVPWLTAIVAAIYFAGFLALGWRRLFTPIFGRAALSPLEYSAALGGLLLATPVGISLLF